VEKKESLNKAEKWKERNVRAVPANKVNLFLAKTKGEAKRRREKSYGIKYSFREPFNQKVESNVRTEYENEESRSGAVE
jgi:hypothetical protein